MILRKHAIPAVKEVFAGGIREDIKDLRKEFRRILDEKCSVDYGKKLDEELKCRQLSTKP